MSLLIDPGALKHYEETRRDKGYHMCVLCSIVNVEYHTMKVKSTDIHVNWNVVLKMLYQPM